MAYQFLGTNPAIDQFNARVTAGDQERRQEEQDFQRRFVLDRQVGLDRGLRDVFGRVGQQVPVGPPAISQFQAAPVQNPAATTPIVSPDQSMVPADNPDYGGPSRAAPMPNVAPRSGVDVPATVSAPPSHAPIMPAAAQTGGPGSYQDVMAGLSKVPGAGNAMLGMYSAERRDRAAARTAEHQQHMEGLKLFADASKNGDVAMMRAVAQRYNFGIPPEVLNRREIMAEIATGMNIAKSQFGHDPEHAMAFTKGYLHAGGSNVDPRQAIQAGIEEAQKVEKPFEASHWVQSPTGEVSAFSKSGERKDTGFKARLPAAGEGGAPGGSKQQQYAEWRISTLVGSGMDENEARKIVAGGARQITDQQRMALARGLMSRSLGSGRYKNINDALKAVDEAVGKSSDAGAPSQPQAPAASTMPAQNAPKRMRFDAAGNEIQ